MSDQYTDFLKAKVAVVEWTGIDVPASRLHSSTLPHQADAIRWMLRIGRGLLAASFGLGKTHAQVEAARIIVEEHGGKFLVVTPLGVRHQFIDEDGPRLGVPFKYVATDAEVEAADTPFLVTNYERIREGHITPAQFTGISLDEGSVLRSLGSDTYAVFERACKDIPFRYVATATPSPNNCRRGFGTELNPDYFKYGLRYMQAIETQKLAPTLFDLLETQSPQPEEQDGN